ncbi:hypothetical protein V5E97_07225 [Singulisphaera sp. Ch08]|uniref:Uncharacterized protein n=1 Tax=Singulisphaera sp. Ch08 TaxID=3120278 RepID=A0AAU7CJX5_9BACT
MSDTTGDRLADRIQALLRSAVLLFCLAAILVGCYTLVLPTRWSTWGRSILLSGAGGLALMLGWPSRRADIRSRTADEIALMWGVLSMVLGIAAAMLIAYGVALQITEERVSPQTLIYRMTHPSQLVALLQFASPAACTGIIGLGIARRRGRAAGRVTMAKSAARFSTIGLGLAALIAATVAAAALYRWQVWG